MDFGKRSVGQSRCHNLRPLVASKANRLICSGLVMAVTNTRPRGDHRPADAVAEFGLPLHVLLVAELRRQRRLALRETVCSWAAKLRPVFGLYRPDDQRDHEYPRCDRKTTSHERCSQLVELIRQRTHKGKAAAEPFDRPRRPRDLRRDGSAQRAAPSTRNQHTTHRANSKTRTERQVYIIAPVVLAFAIAGGVVRIAAPAQVLVPTGARFVMSRPLLSSSLASWLVAATVPLGGRTGGSAAARVHDDDRASLGVRQRRIPRFRPRCQAGSRAIRLLRRSLLAARPHAAVRRLPARTFRCRESRKCAAWFKENNDELHKLNVKVVGHFNTKFLIGDIDGPRRPPRFFKFYRDCGTKRCSAQAGRGCDDDVERAKDGSCRPAASTTSAR